KESLVDALVGGKKEKEECLQIMLKNWGRNFKRSLSYKMLYEGANIKLTAEQRTKEIVEQYDSKKYFGIDRDLFHRTVLEHLDTAHKEWKTLGFLDQLTDVRSNGQNTNPNTSLQTD